MNTKRHLHPLQLLPFVGKSLILLIFPVIRGLLLIRSPDGFVLWLQGAWLDIGLLTGVALFAYGTWRCSTFDCDGIFLTVSAGLIFRRHAVIPLADITTFSLETPYYLSLLGATRVYIDTAGGRAKQPDFQMLLSGTDAKALCAQILPKTTVTPPYYRPNMRRRICLSLAVSHRTTGIFIAAVFLYQSGRILGEEIRELVLAGLQHLAGYVYFIPRTAASIAIVLLVGWVLTFIRNLLHYNGFTVTRYPDAMHIHTAFPIRREYVCPVEAIKLIDARQGLIGCIFRFFMVYFQCIGYGKRKYDEAILLPAVFQKDRHRINTLLPEFIHTVPCVRPPKRALWRYVRWQLLCIFAVFPTGELLKKLLPADLARLTTMCILFPLLWWLTISFISWKRAGFGEKQGFFTLCYHKGFRLHRVIVAARHITTVTVRQSIFQKRHGLCDVYIDTFHERRLSHHIRNVPQIDTKRCFSC